MLILLLFFNDLASCASLSGVADRSEPAGVDVTADFTADVTVDIPSEEKEELFVESLVSLASSILSANDRHGDVCESIRRLGATVKRIDVSHTSMVDAINEGDKRKALISRKLLLRALQDRRKLCSTVLPIVSAYGSDVTDLVSSFNEIVRYGKASSSAQVREKLNEILPFVNKLDDICIIIMASFRNDSEESSDPLRFIGDAIASSVKHQQALEKILEFQVDSEKPLRELIDLVGNSAPLLLQQSIGKMPPQKPKKASKAKKVDDDWLSGVLLAPVSKR